MTKKQLLETLKKKPWLYAVMIGAVLLLIAAILPQKEESLPQTDIDIKEETAAYQEYLTNALTGMLEEIKGVGKVRLYLTFRDSVEYEYLKEETENVDSGVDDSKRDYSESYLFVEDAAGKKSVLAVKRKLPQVSGVAVVCEGGEDAKVKAQVIELLRSLLDLSSANISVSPLA